MDNNITAEYANVGSRLLATLIDALIIIIGSVLFFSFYTAGETNQIISTGMILSALAAGAIYQVASWLFWQATPGMLLTGIRLVTTTNHQEPGLRRCLVRLFAWIITAPLGIGLLLISKNTRRQALHDKISSTLVLTDDESVKSLQQLLEEVE